MRGREKGDKETGAGGRGGAFTLRSYANAQFDATLDWNDLAEIRSRWSGTLALKGVMSAEDG